MSLHPEHGLSYCGVSACHGWGRYYGRADRHCSVCGEEPTPCLTCGCGREINPVHVQKGWTRFCEECGTAWTSAYLGQLMAQELRGVVQELANQKGV